MLLSSKLFNNFFVQEGVAGTVNGSNTAFTISHAPLFSAALLVFQNGLLLRQGTDYTVSGSSITMTAAPSLGTILNSFYIRSL